VACVAKPQHVEGRRVVLHSCLAKITSDNREGTCGGLVVVTPSEPPYTRLFLALPFHNRHVKLSVLTLSVGVWRRQNTAKL